MTAIGLFRPQQRERAAHHGLAVLEGHCFEAHRSLPYGPLIDLLRAAARRERPADSSTDRLVEAIGPGALELVRILPELTPLVPGPAPTPAPEHSE